MRVEVSELIAGRRVGVALEVCCAGQSVDDALLPASREAEQAEDRLLLVAGLPALLEMLQQSVDRLSLHALQASYAQLRRENEAASP